jgi:hypothetical protein
MWALGRLDPVGRSAGHTVIPVLSYADDAIVVTGDAWHTQPVSFVDLVGLGEYLLPGRSKVR